MKSLFTITIHIRVKSGLEKEFKREYLSIIPSILHEKGCINYNLYQSQSDPSRFMLYENWASKEDYYRYLQMSYIQIFTDKAEKYLAEPLEEIDLWNKVF